MTTIKDIARECGVSANTVSSVLNNKQGEVGAETRERVLSAIRRFGYRPHAAARQMVGKSTNTIGIADRYTATSLVDPYKAQILEPVTRTARASHWDVLYYSGHQNEAQAGGFPSFLDGRCDGLICFTGAVASYEVEAMLKSNLPVVFIGEIPETQDGHLGAIIDVDNAAGAFLAVSHLIALGHTRIGMMQGVGISGNQSRVQGYRRALSEQGLMVDEAWIYPTVAWEQSGYQQGITVLSLPPDERPTAIFCFNDVLALGLLRAAEECGVRVPHDLSVIGFDDVLPAASTSPPLTTIRQPLAWIGQRAVEMLIGIMGNHLSRHHHETVDPELIVRASTAPPLRR